MSTVRNSKGDRLSPEFIEREYFDRRISNWKIGNFTDAEIDEFGLDKNNLPKVLDSESHKRYEE